MLDISFATVVSRDVWRKLPNQQPIGPVKFLAQLSRKPGNSLVNTLGKIDPFLHDFSIFTQNIYNPKNFSILPVSFRNVFGCCFFTILPVKTFKIKMLDSFFVPVSGGTVLEATQNFDVV